MNNDQTEKALTRLRRIFDAEPLEMSSIIHPEPTEETKKMYGVRLHVYGGDQVHPNMDLDDLWRGLENFLKTTCTKRTFGHPRYPRGVLYHHCKMSLGVVSLVVHLEGTSGAWWHDTRFYFIGTMDEVAEYLQELDSPQSVVREINDQIGRQRIL